MAHTKAQRAVRGNRDGNPKYLGIKLYGGQAAVPGNIIVRQRGSKIRSGDGTMRAKDFTIHAMIEGVVTYYQRLGKKYVAVRKQT
jgi:large subunit ribosomal protein L27